MKECNVLNVSRYEKTDFQKEVAVKFATLEGLGNWRRVDAARSIEDVHVSHVTHYEAASGDHAAAVCCCRLTRSLCMLTFWLLQKAR
jgi:hypothetical protein